MNSVQLKLYNGINQAIRTVDTVINKVDQTIQYTSKDLQKFRDGLSHVRKNDFAPLEARIHQINNDILICENYLKGLNFNSNAPMTLISLGSTSILPPPGHPNFPLNGMTKNLIVSRLNELAKEKNSVKNEIINRIEILSKIIYDSEQFLHASDCGIILNKVFQTNLDKEACSLQAAFKDLLNK